MTPSRSKRQEAGRRATVERWSRVLALARALSHALSRCPTGPDGDLQALLREVYPDYSGRPEWDVRDLYQESLALLVCLKNWRGLVDSIEPREIMQAAHGLIVTVEQTEE